MRLFNKKTDLMLLLRGIGVIACAAIALETTSLIQYYFSRKGLEEEATLRAEGELNKTNLEITSVVDQVETAIRNNLWSVRQELGNVDSLYKITRRIVEDNPVIIGSAIALLPEYRTARGQLLAPYSYLDGSDIRSKQLGTDEYNYLKMEWFTESMATHEGHWSEPYYDAGGGEMMMTTYSFPIQDKKGNYVGVVTADLSLDWLTELVSKVQVYPGTRSTLISKRGTMMVVPDDDLVMQTTILDGAKLTGDPQAMAIGQEMLAGHSGSRKVTYSGIQRHVFYAPIPRTGWSMAIIIPSDEIFRSVKRIGLIVTLLQVLALLTLALIIQRTARNLVRYQKVADTKERIENELIIASKIQMAMLPKIFPPYPDRSDIDIFATLVPAKEVGGDLFDYFIRDERLFFCIGDVSGKGVPASLVMAVTRSLFRTVSGHEIYPARIITHMNDSMSEGNDSNMFVTFFVGVLDLATGQLRYCNAGHNTPLLLHDGAAKPIDIVPNLPLGVAGGMRFVQQEMTLPPDSSLFLYTDGLTGAENAGHQLFGEQRLEEAAGKVTALSAHELVESIHDAVRQHVETAPQSDDLTMLCIRYQGQPDQLSDRHLILHNDIQQIPQLADFVETIAEESGLSQPLAMSLNLALEEAVTNVIVYAYPDGTDGLVDIEAILHKDRIRFIISDSGQPFDPTQVQEPDLSLPLEERPIGGLGIHLVRSIMDEVSYERTADKNILYLLKRL